MNYCALCNEQVKGTEQLNYQVLGWEAPRKGGGTNALRLRQRTGLVAHRRCVDDAVKGLHHQDSLFTT